MNGNGETGMNGSSAVLEKGSWTVGLINSRFFKFVFFLFFKETIDVFKIELFSFIFFKETIDVLNLSYFYFLSFKDTLDVFNLSYSHFYLLKRL